MYINPDSDKIKWDNRGNCLNRTTVRKGEKIVAQLIHTSIGRVLLQEKHAMSILIALRDKGVASVEEIREEVKGSPAAVGRTLDELEELGILTRKRQAEDRRVVQIRLTLRGLMLAERSPSNWIRIINNWNRVQ